MNNTTARNLVHPVSKSSNAAARAWSLAKSAATSLTVWLVAALQTTLCSAWTIEPVDLSGTSGWSLAIDTDPSGSPQAAFYTTNPNGAFRYTRRGPSGWQQQGAVELADAFALDKNGQRFFIAAGPSPNYYPQFQTLLDNGMVLSNQIAATGYGDVFLDFDSQNRPQIGWVDSTAQQLKYSFWNGASWTTRTVASSVNSNFAATLDDSDQMHFSWRNSSTSRLQYAKPNGTTWQITSPFPTLDARPLDLDIDSTGKAHLAYDVFTGLTSTGGLFYSSLTGSTWTGGRIPGLDGFGAERSKVVADSAGKPHLFTYDSTFAGPEKLKHIFRDSANNWTSETIDQYTSNTSGPEDIEVTYDTKAFHVLYSTGNEQIYYATQAATLPGDYDANGVVDTRDFVKWRKGLGSTYTQADYASWRASFGQTAGAGASLTLEAVPEPSTMALCFVAFAFRARRSRPAQ